jgi:hypothetical protein
MRNKNNITQTINGAFGLFITALTLPLFWGGGTEASAQTATTIHVEAVLVNFQYVTGYQRRPNAYVYVKDNLGQPVAGATMYGAWSGCLPGTGSAVTQIYTTDAKGNPMPPYSYAQIVHPKTHSCGGKGSKSCSFIFTVTSMTHPSLQYDPNANVQTSGGCPCF